MNKVKIYHQFEKYQILLKSTISNEKNNAHKDQLNVIMAKMIRVFNRHKIQKTIISISISQIRINKKFCRFICLMSKNKK